MVESLLCDGCDGTDVSCTEAGDVGDLSCGGNVFREDVWGEDGLDVSAGGLGIHHAVLHKGVFFYFAAGISVLAEFLIIRSWTIWMLSGCELDLVGQFHVSNTFGVIALEGCSQLLLLGLLHEWIDTTTAAAMGSTLGALGTTSRTF